MKNLFGLLFVALTLAFVSCGDSGCAEDFAGVYTGTNDCSVLGEMAETVTITGTDGDYSVSGASLMSTSLEQDGCTLSYDVTPLGTGETVEITLSGNTLTVTRDIKTLGATVETCVFTGTK